MEKRTKLLNGKNLGFLLVLLITCAAPILNIVFSYMLKFIIDAGLSRDVDKLKTGIIFGLGLITIFAITNYLVMVARNAYISHTIKKYKDQAFDTIIHKDYASFSQSNTGSYISYLTTSMKKVEDEYLFEFFSIVRNIALMTFSLIGMFVGNWKLTFIIMLACIFPILITGFIGKSVTQVQSVSTIQEQKFMTFVKDLLSGFLVIKSFHVEKNVFKSYQNKNRKLADAYLKQKNLDAAARSVSEFAGMWVFLVAFSTGMFMVIQNNITLGSIMAIIQLVNYVVGPLNELGINVNKFKAGKGVFQSIETLLHSKNQDLLIGHEDKTKEEFNHSIKFDDVTFSYPGYSDGKPALKNISYEFKKGKKYALVGLSGSGKTSIMNLLLRFYEVGQGKILIDDINIKDIDLNSIYHLMTIVQQSVYVFDSTLKENITLNENYSDEEILNAIRQAGLSNVIENSPEGFHMLCGENGNLLSGGERQRLSIARSIIRKTPVLLMDEATSALDQKTTFEIENSILSIKDLTAIIITHKLNEQLLRQYDEIVLMKNGMISETGTFEELIEKNAEFASIYKISLSE